MIIDKNTNPQRDIYYLGAIFIGILTNYESSINYYDAFELMNENEKISINLFSLTLDWLFLLGVITIEKGRILKCF